MTNPRALLGAVLVIAAAAWAVPADVAAEQAPGVVILSPYRSLVGANARPRLLPHAGVDVAAWKDKATEFAAGPAQGLRALG